MPSYYHKNQKRLTIKGRLNVTAKDVQQAGLVTIDTLEIANCRSIDLSGLTQHGIKEVTIKGGKVKGLKDFEIVTIEKASSVRDVQATIITISGGWLSSFLTKISLLQASRITIEYGRRVRHVKAAQEAEIVARSVSNVEAPDARIKAAFTKNIQGAPTAESKIHLKAYLYFFRNRVSNISGFETIKAEYCLFGSAIAAQKLDKTSSRQSIWSAITSHKLHKKTILPTTSTSKQQPTRSPTTEPQRLPTPKPSKRFKSALLRVFLPNQPRTGDLGSVEPPFDLPDKSGVPTSETTRTNRNNR